MTDTERIREDIAYVRAATEGSATLHDPASYLLWAAIALCGFILPDFEATQPWIAIYWLVAGPVGFGVSMWLGIRAGRRAGQADRREGVRWSLHWLSFMVAGLLGWLLVAAGQLTLHGYCAFWVLLIALTYCQAGVHLDRRLAPIGVVVGVGYLITFVVPGYRWSVAGGLIAVALVAQAFLGAPTRDPAR